MLKVVIDSNVFISSLLSKTGAPAQTIDAWRNRSFILVMSPEIIEEIHRVLRNPNLQERYGYGEEEIQGLIDLIEHDALHVPGYIDVAGSIPEDPDDEKFLACALNAEADFIVSGDRHLLSIREFRRIPILSVQEFLTRLEGRS